MYLSENTSTKPIVKKGKELEFPKVVTISDSGTLGRMAQQIRDSGYDLSKIEAKLKGSQPKRKKEMLKYRRLMQIMLVNPPPKPPEEVKPEEKIKKITKPKRKPRVKNTKDATPGKRTYKSRKKKIEKK